MTSLPQQQEAACGIERDRCGYFSTKIGGNSPFVALVTESGREKIMNETLFPQQSINVSEDHETLFF